MAIQFILLLIAAYLVGSIPTAYLVVKWRRGIDIRKFGSGNAGASNVMAAVGKKWAIPVTLFDIGKGALMVWLAQRMGFSVAQESAAGIAAIAGHNWTAFLNFNGGRGILTSLGVIFVLAPRVGLVALAVPYLFFAPFRQLALGVTVTLLALPVLAAALPQAFGIRDTAPVALGFLGILLIALLRRVTAPRSSISASVPTRELILYRLLFDRDIRDRKAWISRTTEGTDTDGRKLSD